MGETVLVTTVLPALPSSPMLATPAQSQTGPEWIVEAKWDGARAPTRVHGSAVDLFSRPGYNLAARSPDLLAGLQSALDGRTVILDGEIVALGSDGRPDFDRLAQRLRVTSPNARLRTTVPARYLLFDILHLDGTNLNGMPYAQRREALETLGLSRDGNIVVPPCWHGLDGHVLLAVTPDLALEGVVCKRATSTYQPGRRSRSWVKTVIRRKAPLVLVGWVPAARTRSARCCSAGMTPTDSWCTAGRKFRVEPASLAALARATQATRNVDVTN